MGRAGDTDGDEFDPGPFRSAGTVLAHDLTNHLHVIEGHTDLLLDRLDDPDAVDRLTVIKQQAVAAHALLQSVSMVALGKAPDRLEAVDAGRLIEIEAERIRSAYPHADLSVDVQEGITVRADELLSSVFRNLIQNAVEHNDSTAPGVSVTARSDGSETVVVVEDDGPGLHDSVEKGLLGGERAPPGSGVWIVSTLLDRYGAAMSVETGADGTRISMTFPSDL